MKIIVVEFDSSGGLIHYAYQFCTALAEQGLNVRLITGTEYELAAFPHSFAVDSILRLWPRHASERSQSAASSPLAALLHRAGRLPRRGLRAIRLIIAWRRATNHILKHAPDVVQFSEIHFFFEAYFLWKLKRNDILLSQICHEFEHREERGVLKWLTSRLHAATFAQFSVILFLSDHIRRKFLERYDFPSRQTHLLPHGNEAIFLKQAKNRKNGENLRERYNLENDALVVLFFGTLVPSKGVEDLIDAFALVEAGSKTRLLIAGYPSKYIDPHLLRQRVADLHLDRRVIFDLRYLPLESIAQLMEIAAMAVFPYHSSTQSGALQVAYTFGLPVIAANVGGLAEVVEDGESGYLVPPRRPDLLAKAITDLLQSPETRERLGRRARYLSETTHSWEAIARTIAEIYAGLLQA